MQVDIADRRNDRQLMYNKGKQLVFTSNTENVFFLELGRHCIYTDLKKSELQGTGEIRLVVRRPERTVFFPRECKYNP